MYMPCIPVPRSGTNAGQNRDAPAERSVIGCRRKRAAPVSRPPSPAPKPRGGKPPLTPGPPREARAAPARRDHGTATREEPGGGAAPRKRDRSRLGGPEGPGGAALSPAGVGKDDPPRTAGRRRGGPGGRARGPAPGPDGPLAGPEWHKRGRPLVGRPGRGTTQGPAEPSKRRDGRPDPGPARGP